MMFCNSFDVDAHGEGEIAPTPGSRGAEMLKRAQNPSEEARSSSFKRAKDTTTHHIMQQGLSNYIDAHVNLIQGNTEALATGACLTTG